MTVLVTGATGFLGSHLALALRDTGVVATGRDHAKLDRLAAHGVRCVPIDLSRPVAQADRDRIGPISAVVHCAGLSSPWGARSAFETANVAGTRTIADLAQAMGVARFVQISTASVYFQFLDQDNLTEDALPPRFINHYAATKRQAEIDVLSRRDINPVVLRPRGIYGAGDTALLPRLMRVAKRRPVPRFHPCGATDITHVDDVVGACRAALSHTVGGVFNISGGEGIALPDIISAACAASDVPLRWRTLPFAPTLQAVRALEALARVLPHRPEPPVTAYGLGILRYRQTVNIDRAKDLLGWKPQVSFADGLARTFSNGALRQGVIS